MPITSVEQEQWLARPAVSTRIVIAHSRRCPITVYSPGGIARLARTMILRHGSGAARAAAERVNAMIDRGDGLGRDLWACVVHAIHEIQGGGGLEDGGSQPRQTERFFSPRRPRRLALAWRRRGGT